MIGSPMATTEPKVSSRITIAASRAMPSLAPWRSVRWAFWIVVPPSSTWIPLPPAPRAVSMTRRTAALGRSMARRSNWTVPKAVCPAGAMAAPPVRAGA